MLILVDALNVFLRNFAANPTLDSNGTSIGGVVGSLRTISDLSCFKSNDIIFVWDGVGGSQKRRGIYADYKNGKKPRLNRQFDIDSQKESFNNLNFQIELLKKYLTFLGIRQVKVDNIEADDVIGFLVQKYEDEIIIVSSDKDFLQLVDEDVNVFAQHRKTLYTPQEVVKEFSVLPANFIYYKAIIGDPSDNVKGVDGVGAKAIEKFIPLLKERQVDLNELLLYCSENSDKSNKLKKIVENKELIQNNIKLMQLSSVIISIQSMNAIEFQLSKKVMYESIKFKINLISDGLPVTPSDFMFLRFRSK